MNVKEIKAEKDYFKLVAEAKAKNIPFNKVKKEDLRKALVAASAKPAKKAEKSEPAVKAVAVVIEISKADEKELAKLATKKEKVIKAVTEFGYPVAVVANHPLVSCHPTNAHAILRAAGLSTSTRTQSQETKDKIRATVVAKIEAEAEAAE